ncbi:MAG: sugar phosphate isomerase/epimerase [Henriciella sp.]|nr:sugar phosphate isomerase/epimerase [Henriciella sp.]
MGASGAAFLVGACGSAGSPAAPQRKIGQIGIQTYTLRAALAEDFVGTFQMIKDVGYDYVELNRRNFVERTPAELKTLLDDIGLPSPITHLDYDMFATRTTEIGDIAGELGCEHAILPWLTEDQRTLDGYKAHAEMLNRAGEVLKPYGVTVGYHNHQFEFFDLGGGQSGMEILLSETDPDNVAFELDLFWVALTGTDIVALFNKHSGRFKYCHVKDLTGDASAFRESVDFEAIVATHMANVGEGDLPFESYFAAADIAGLEYYIAEHDNPPLPYRQSVETSYNSMKAMRF